MDIQTTLSNVGKKIFGTQNDRELKFIRPIVAKINQLEPSIKALSDDQLRGKTVEFKERLAKGETLDQILPEAYAVVREAAWRSIGLRHYDVQLIGGITLHRGRIAEMRTGEGKTLVATLPSYLNALTGKGVHVITVNDYLARRDAQEMGRVHRFLGLTTGIIVHGLSDSQRKQNYACDITYGTNNEFGFDYLRDNMKFRLEDYVQRELNYCIVDEVDSILIDEARTPLIISGPTDETTDLYYKINSAILQAQLVKGEERDDVENRPETGDYTVEEKTKTASLTEEGVAKMERVLGIENLYDPIHIELLHHVNQGLRAHVLFKRDVDYVVRDGEVMIVDEFTGRLMPGRRWSDGLHQAIEAKENVNIENENQTLATVTFQNYFRMYKKLSGMTGTADTEATEFGEIYGLSVTVIPTNRPMIRKDQPDMIYKAEQGKFKAIAQEIKRVHEKGQPVLVGTVSVEKSERLSHLLNGLGIKHNVLNAKQHEREAEIVAQAGRKGAVTIATNMAGRGTDILLGGNAEFMAKHEVGPVPVQPAEMSAEEFEAIKAEYQRKVEEGSKKWKELCAKEREEVKAAGGLFILGTERHESRRIDNQLRGRAGRQGDPGESRFYLSLDDDLMRIFGSVNIGRFMEEDMPIEHKWITNAIANAQKKVEGHHYDIRKHLLEYDDVMNQQRKIVYEWRREVLELAAHKEMIFSMVKELSANIGEEFFPRGKLRKDESGQSHLDINELNTAIRQTFQIDSNIREADINPFNNIGLAKLITEMAEKAYAQKAQELGPEMIGQVERMILLTTIDHLWKDHLLAMDHLREGINLNAYGQKDPLVEYKKQGFNFFQMMMGQISSDVVRKIFAVQLAPAEDMQQQFTDEEEEFEDEMGEAFPEQSMQYNISEDGTLIPLEGGAPSEAEAAAHPAPSQGIAPDLMAQMRAPRQMNLSRGPVGGGLMAGNGPMANPMPASSVDTSEVDKAGRNDPCPCGSGKKYKKCHGA